MSCDDVPGIPSGDAFAVSIPMPLLLRWVAKGLTVSLIDEITDGDCAGNYQIARTLEIENCAEAQRNTRTP